jgi:hypothetical protein
MTDKKVTLTEDELEAWYAAKRADEQMPDDEKKVRAVVREEVASALGSFFENAPDPEGDGDKGKGNKPGGVAEPGLFDKLASWLGGEPAKSEAE